MRRLRLYLFIATAALSLAPAAPTLAQYPGHGGGQEPGGGDDDQAAADAKAKKRKQAFGLGPGRCRSRTPGRAPM